MNVTAQSIPHNKLLTWFSQAPWRILAIGALAAIGLAALLMWQLMNAPISEITALVSTLSLTSILSLGLGYILYRQRWARSRSLVLTLILTYGWAALLTLFNVWVMSVRMYVNQHDLILGGVLLLFAAVIATTFGIFVAASITDGLRQLADSAHAVAAGQLDTRIAIMGQDEVALLGTVFNKMASQLQQAAQERAELESLRRDLIAWTSHDLRTPLTSVRALIETLHDGVVDDPETVQRYYRTIRADVIALNDLIDDLFELAQLDAGGLKFDLAPYSVKDLVLNSLDHFRALAEQRQITLESVVGEQDETVWLDAAKISRVLANQLSNALRYTPVGGRIIVQITYGDDAVKVAVQDNGPGFNPDDLSRVFEKFYRGEQARSRATGGGGLGLAIAKGIVEAHNGRIWANNVSDGGARVSFSLPIRPLDANDTPPIIHT